MKHTEAVKNNIGAQRKPALNNPIGSCKSLFFLWVFDEPLRHKSDCRLKESSLDGHVIICRVMRTTFWLPTWSDTIQDVLSLKMARGLKFRIWKVEGLYYPCSENRHMQKAGFLITRLIITIFHMNEINV